jgi:hypothetical protein
VHIIGSHIVVANAVVCCPHSLRSIQGYDALHLPNSNCVPPEGYMEIKFCTGKRHCLLSVELSQMGSFYQEGGMLGFNPFFEQFIGTRCEHTIVCHPVGYHNDVFRNGHTNCMKNRLSWTTSQPYSREANFPVGRGGGLGNGKYARALLDW